MAKAARTKQAIDPAALLARIDAAIGECGAVDRALMKAVAPVLAELRPILVARGYEIGTTVRSPVRAQIEAALERAGNAGMDTKQLGKAINGANAPEIKAGLRAAALEGVVIEAHDGASARLYLPIHAKRFRPGVDSKDYVALLRAEIKRVSKAQKSKLGTGLPAPWYQPCFAPVDKDGSHGSTHVNGLPTVAAHASTAAPVAPSPVDDATLLTQLIAAARRERQPAYVPTVLRSLGLPPSAAQQVLLAGARAGRFDLEPESGMARLSAEDAAWCPAGPGQTRLSWLTVRGDR